MGSKKRVVNTKKKTVYIFFYEKVNILFCFLTAVSFNLLLEGGGVSTDEFVNLLASLEELEGGHGTDAEGSSDVFAFINIELEELDVLVGVFVGESFHGGGNHSARAAPGGESVDDGQFILGDGSVEFSLRLDNLDGHFVLCKKELKITVFLKFFE